MLVHEHTNVIDFVIDDYPAVAIGFMLSDLLDSEKLFTPDIH